MTLNDLFSTKTKKHLQMRENWLYQLFSNTKITPSHKVVMAAFTLWYMPTHQSPAKNNLLGVSLDYSELAELAGMTEEETREALLDMVQAGVFTLYDEHGHPMEVETRYECEDCGHEWEEKHE